MGMDRFKLPVRVAVLLVLIIVPSVFAQQLLTNGKVIRVTGAIKVETPVGASSADCVTVAQADA
jgi:hypothetical protein